MALIGVSIEVVFNSTMLGLGGKLWIKAVLKCYIESYKLVHYIKLKFIFQYFICVKFNVHSYPYC